MAIFRPIHWKVSFVVAFLAILGVRSDDVFEHEIYADGTYEDEVYGEVECTDDHELCHGWAEMGECESNPGYMMKNCRLSCNHCVAEKKKSSSAVEQAMGSNSEERKMIESKLREMKEYMELIQQDKALESVWELCAGSLKHESCLLWAAQGECDANSAYMLMNCAAACGTCDWLDVKIRCPLEDPMAGVWQPGDLDELFTNITTDGKYDVNILSQPPDPWVVTIDDFVSAEEAEMMIQLGRENGYVRSGGVGKILEDGTVENIISESRTSSNAWCNSKACMEDPASKAVSRRVTELTHIPQLNHEHLQLLHYKVGQYYKSHHDFIPSHFERPIGARILTVFMYLNDVEEGGGTNFTLLDIEVKPKRGRVLIWPSVLNDDPHRPDKRTDHEALPVIKGEKFACNAWLHQREYKRWYEKNCD